MWVWLVALLSAQAVARHIECRGQGCHRSNMLQAPPALQSFRAFTSSHQVLLDENSMKYMVNIGGPDVGSWSSDSGTPGFTASPSNVLDLAKTKPNLELNFGNDDLNSILKTRRVGASLEFTAQVTKDKCYTVQIFSYEDCCNHDQQITINGAVVSSPLTGQIDSDPILTCMIFTTNITTTSGQISIHVKGTTDGANAVVNALTISSCDGSVVTDVDGLNDNESPEVIVTPKGLEFDGNSKVIISGFAGFPTSSWTFLSTIRVLAPSPHVPVTGKETILSFFSQASNGLHFTLENPSNLEIGYGKEARQKIKCSVSIADGNWHTLALVYAADTATLSIYVDGRRSFFAVLAGVNPGQQHVFFDGMGSLVIGQRQACSGGCFQFGTGLRARMKYVSLWRIAFPGREVEATLSRDTEIPEALLAGKQALFYYPLTDGHGEGALDTSGNSLNGDFGATTCVVAGDSKAFYFSGTSFVTNDGQIKDIPTSQITIAGWLQTTDTDDVAIVGFSTETDPIEILLRNPSAIKVTVAKVEFETSAAVNDGKWHHIALTVQLESSATLTLFVDGKVAKKFTSKAELRLSREGQFILGQLPTCNGGCFDPPAAFEGFMQSIRVWSVALTDEQVVADAARKSETFNPKSKAAQDSNLIFVWRADMQQDVLVNDLSASGHNARLGAPIWRVDCPNGCTHDRGHGVCLTNGQCQCVEGVSGEDCSEGCLHGCSERGTCINGVCECFPMFEGRDCSESPFLTIEPTIDCGAFEFALPTDRFCTMIDTSATYPTAKVSEIAFKKFDSEASIAFERLSGQCQNPYGKKLLKGIVCQHFFPPCKNGNAPAKPCTESCSSLVQLCNLPKEICELGLFSADPQTCTNPKVEDEISDCLHKCRGNGVCSKGKCVCNEGYSGEDCLQYVGDKGTKFGVGRRQTFCDMLDYNVPRAVNLTWADQAANQAFDKLKPFCSQSTEGLTKLKMTMCATSHLKLDLETGSILHPCRSMCQDYASYCGITGIDMCFGSFYADPPNCFSMFTEAEATAIEVKEKIESCTDKIVCTNGHCKAGTCVCDDGWYGSQCQISLPTCVGYCSGHGVCQGGLCKCLPGWGGQACDEQDSKYCDMDCLDHGNRHESCCQIPMSPFYQQIGSVPSKQCAKNCSGHGSCSSNAYFCECEPGWFGVECDQGKGNAFGCVRDCSGHGSCQILETPAGEKRCKCYSGFHGIACSESSGCPLGCSNRGKCQEGKCVCNLGSFGPGCEHENPKCPHFLLCQNGGMCFKDGQCVCPRGFSGIDCSIKEECPKDFKCLNDGVCEDGRCECPVFWQGLDCSQKVPPVPTKSRIV